MDPIIGASLIGAGTSILGGLFSSNSQSKTNEANLQIARENRDWQERMWNLQNEYNTPQNQLALYQEAGFNPLTALDRMAGVSSAGAVSTPSMPVMNPTDYGFLSDAGQQIMNGLVAKAQVDNLNADTTGKRIKNNYSPAQYEAEIKQLQAASDKLHQDTQNALAEYDNIRKTAKKIDAETERTQAETANLEKSGKNIDANTAKTVEETETIKASRQKVLDKLDAEINNLNEQLRLMPFDAKTRRISAQAMATQASAAKQLASIQAQRWEIEKDEIIPQNIKLLGEQLSTAIATRKITYAQAELAKMSADLQKSKPDEWRLWFSEGGYIDDLLGSVGRAVGVAIDAKFKTSMAKTARKNADTNRMNAERPSPLGSYTNSYGVNSTWNP